jgi:hypothetical protein
MPYDLNIAPVQDATVEPYIEPETSDEEREEYQQWLEIAEDEHRLRIEHDRIVKLDEAAELEFYVASEAIFEKYAEVDEVHMQHNRTSLFFTALTGLMSAAREHYGEKIVDGYLAELFPIPWSMRAEATSLARQPKRWGSEV